MRTTLLGSLLDAARHNAARGVADVRAVRGRRGLPRPTARTRAAARTSTDALGGAAAPGRAAPAVVARRREPPRGRLLRRQGRARRRCSTRCACRWTRRAPRAEPFLHPGRSARVLAGGEAVGLARRAAPARRARVGPRRTAARVRARPRPRARATPTPCRTTRDLTSFPALRQDLAVVVADDVPAARVLAVVREAGGELLRRRARSSTSTAASRWGRGARRSRCALEFRAPDRTLTDEDVAPRARARSSPRCATSSGASCVASVDRRSAPSGYAGALAAAAAAPPPALRARRGHRAQRRRRAARRPLPAPPRAARRSRSSTSTRHGAGRRGDRRLPARRRRAGGRRAARARRARRRPVAPTSACATVDIYEELVRRAPARPSCSARPSTGCPSCTATQIARRRPRRQPRLLPDRGAARAGAARARGLIDDVVDRRQVRRVGRRARADARRRTSSPPTRTSRPTGRAATATRPRSSRSWPRSAPPLTRHVHAAPAAARPGRARLLLRARRRDAARRRRVAELFERRLRATSRSSSCADAAARRARRARDQLSAASTRAVDERTGKVIVFAAIDNLWKGAVVAGGPEPQPDVRTSTRRTGCCERLLLLALGRGARARAPRRRGGLPAGFRAAGVAAGLKPSAAAPTSACSSATRPTTTSAARFTRSGVLAAPVLRDPGARAARRAARGGRQLRQRQRRHRAAAGSTTPRKMQGAAAMAGGRARATRSRSPRPA